MTSDLPLSRQRVLDAVNEHQQSKPRGLRDSRYWGERMQLLISAEFRSLLHQAARGRNISLTGYARRALARQMAEDLGMDPHEILSVCPYPTDYGQTVLPKEKRGQRKKNGALGPSLPDDGEGHGDWGW